MTLNFSAAFISDYSMPPEFGVESRSSRSLYQTTPILLDLGMCHNNIRTYLS
ncbi:hypothetical protein GQ55_9G448700 [Panicum hallii var. hallii]|uniref:Uncharacterized protein n=1 Tax=Panicum hallii var. hallii TaxID=1504633 RepID=A0A2T7CBY1_9POAL|nr:hypothetical protein GQ55_9G448700 [Panicum hallii var. hallii]